MAATARSEGPTYMYGVLLQQERTKINISRHRLADICGVSVRVVRQWEDGRAVPTNDQLERLESKIRTLRKYRHLAKPKPTEAPQAPPSLAPALQVVRPAPEPTSEQTVKRRFHKKPMGRPIEQYPTFGRALRAARLAEGIKADELAKLLGLAGSGTISHWEMGRTTPVRENYEKLLELLPVMKDAKRPEAVKTRGVPPGNRTPHQPPPGPRPRFKEPLTQNLAMPLQQALEGAQGDAKTKPSDPAPVAATPPPPTPAPKSTTAPAGAGAKDHQLLAIASQEYAQAQEALEATAKEIRDHEIRVDMLKRKLKQLYESHATLTEARDKAYREMKDLL